MNKNLKIVFIFFILTQSVALSAPMSPDWVMYFQNYVINRQSNRAVIYNALNLTDEQRIKYKQITEKDDAYYKKYFDELVCQTFELKALKEAKAPIGETYEQKRIVKKITRDIKKISRQEDRELKKILTRKQISKYSMIKKLERHDLKKEYHPKDYYKYNKQMQFFGDPRLNCTKKD